MASNQQNNKKKKSNVSSVVGLLARIVITLFIGCSISSASLGDLRTLVLVASLILIIPVLAALFSSNDHNLMAFVVIVVAVFALIGSDIFIKIGALALGAYIVCFAFGDFAFHLGYLKKTRKYVKEGRCSTKHVLRVSSSVIADLAFTATGVGIALCSIVSGFNFYSLAMVCSLIACVFYCVRFIFNIAIKHYDK